MCDTVRSFNTCGGYDIPVPFLYMSSDFCSLNINRNEGCAMNPAGMPFAIFPPFAFDLISEISRYFESGSSTTRLCKISHDDIDLAETSFALSHATISFKDSNECRDLLATIF
jgi:hypothetical protein